MAWTIECTNCDRETNPANISELMKCRDNQGWFLCEHCKSRGYIKKRFELQEKNVGPWNPYLKGAIRPSGHDENNTYQPFAFLVSYAPKEDPGDVWFCYYKDTRGEEGGRLKMGHGPGGPPVFSAEGVLDLVVQMVECGCLDADTAVDAIRDAQRGQHGE